MRLWSLHPELLDRAALVACWREGLLAQKVLAGRTTGYRNHPQLHRFRAHPDPMAAIGAYLVGLRSEAGARGYRFDATRILRPDDEVGLGRAETGRTETDRAEPLPLIPVTTGQLAYELEHLRRKCADRSPDWLPRLPDPGTAPSVHPLLTPVPGDVEPWEVR